METRHAGKTKTGNDLENRLCERVWEIYQTLDASAVSTFTPSRIESWWQDLSTIAYTLTNLPEPVIKDFLLVIERLHQARNELRHARFVFDVEEIPSLYRLLLRNRAVLEAKELLRTVVHNWPAHPSSHT